jgi:organic radical activating enzyme
MIKNESLPVMETFYTVQGEGVFTGAAAYFIRLAGCDVGCVWCDVKESWDASIHPSVKTKKLVDDVVASGAIICVVTGGEPAMHDLTELTELLRSKNIRTHIETSGTHELTGTWDWVTFSPKKFKAPVDSIYKLADELKIIVFNKSDLDWAINHAEQVNQSCKLYLQPEWEKREIMQGIILDFIRQKPTWRISIQTHKYLGVD